MSDFTTDLQIHAYTLLSNGDKFSGEKMKRAAAEITRLTEALAASESRAGRLAEMNRKHCEAVNTLLLENSRLDDRVTASEEARRAERAAVVRKCAKVYRTRSRFDEGDYPEWDYFRGAELAILALATDADNAALDRLIQERIDSLRSLATDDEIDVLDALIERSKT